jgi:hypothetical protein
MQRPRCRFASLAYATLALRFAASALLRADEADSISSWIALILVSAAACGQPRQGRAQVLALGRGREQLEESSGLAE